MICWFCNPPSFETVSSFICGRRRVAVARYWMIFLVHENFNLIKLHQNPLSGSGKEFENRNSWTGGQYCIWALGSFAIKEKKEEIWLSPVTKAHTPTEKSKKQRDDIKTPPKALITQRLRTDLGRSAGVTAVTPLSKFGFLSLGD